MTQPPAPVTVPPRRSRPPEPAARSWPPPPAPGRHSWWTSAGAIACCTTGTRRSGRWTSRPRLPARSRPCSPARRPGSRRCSRNRRPSPTPPAAVARSAARRARTSRSAASTPCTSPGARRPGHRPRGRPPCPRRPCCCAVSSWSRAGPRRRTSTSTWLATRSSTRRSCSRSRRRSACGPTGMRSRRPRSRRTGRGSTIGLLSARLAEVAAAVPGFAVVPRTVVGNFSYTKLPMVTDLQVHADALAAHDLVAAIAGDAAAQRAVRARQAPVEPVTLDAVPPAAEFLVLDADASQQAVIETVVRGSDSVVQGPPGTGKSQTIANLIASATAQGLRVLFVAEKRAAIDAVVGRLDRTGLSDLVLDLHGGVSSRRRLAENLAAALSAARATAEPESATVEGFLAGPAHGPGGPCAGRQRAARTLGHQPLRGPGALGRGTATGPGRAAVAHCGRPDHGGPAGRAEGGAAGVPRPRCGGPRRRHTRVVGRPDGGRGRRRGALRRGHRPGAGRAPAAARDLRRMWPRRPGLPGPDDRRRGVRTGSGPGRACPPRVVGP